MRLGFGVKVLGRPGLKSHDSRRWQNNPHLSVSLAYLRDIFEYLKQHDIRMYRMSSELAPYVTHPDLPQFHHQIDECARELALVGQMARDAGLRLSFHPKSHVNLSTPDPQQADRSARELMALARILDAMGLGREAVIVVHVGGAYDDKNLAATRFVQRFMQLPAFVCRRLALEHDDAIFSLADIHKIHQQTGIPLVLDYLHFRCHNPEGLSLKDALAMALGTWPADVRPKVHFSSPRTEMRILHRPDPVTGDGRDVLRPPLPSQHADFAHPFEFMSFLSVAKSLWGSAADAGREFDIMLELKAKDLAVRRLRDDVERFAPELAWWLEGGPVSQVRELEQAWSVEHVMSEAEPARVLVAVVNNPRDLEIAQEQGWYRIPLKRAPRQVAADFLALYQTAAFSDEKWAVNYFAPVRRYHIVRRRDLLPDEADHPRADDLYYKVEIDPLERLPAPIPSRRLRRITFIATTLERLLSAEEINDLWMSGISEAELWDAFKQESAEVESASSGAQLNSTEETTEG
ncbi:MAG: UV DNA damage repair endonuclease UvsE [Chloroflexi bacterium]|nr:MAG: UV DNA damage repair endonuclease UvsE [Chloroflexota bacterium]